MSKDYSVIDGICRNFEYEAKTIFNKGYDQGVEDTKYEKQKVYEQGLDDAWMCARKLVSPNRGGISEEEKYAICGKPDSDYILLEMTAKEAKKHMGEKKYE